MTVTAIEWEDLLEKYKHQCLCCGATELPLTKDHVIPTSVGGEDIIQNVQPLCRICNSEKGDATIDYRGSKMFSGQKASENFWYDIRHAANFLDKSPATIKYYIRKNLIPHMTGSDGKKYVWIADDNLLIKDELINISEKVDRILDMIKCKF